MQVTRSVRSVHRVAPRESTPRGLGSHADGAPHLGVSYASGGTCSEPAHLATLLKAVLGVPQLIPTSELRELITFVEWLQEELRALDSGPVRTPPVPTRLGESLLRGRGQEVLNQLKVGRSEKEIARAMGRSPHTIHCHVKRIYRHFNVSSRSELLALWVRAA